MKAEELRIGNIVSRTNKLTKKETLIQLTASCILDISSNGENSSFIYEYVPLTEEWLVKFGFGKDNGYPYKMLNGWIRIRNGIYFFKFYTLEVELPYVHTLQNLYYSLTNTELK